KRLRDALRRIGSWTRRTCFVASKECDGPGGEERSAWGVWTILKRFLGGVGAARWYSAIGTPTTQACELQKAQYGPGAGSSLRNAPPTGAITTAISLAGLPVSLRPICPCPVSTYPSPALTTVGEQVGSSTS